MSELFHCLKRSKWLEKIIAFLSLNSPTDFRYEPKGSEVVEIVLPLESAIIKLLSSCSYINSGWLSPEISDIKTVFMADACLGNPLLLTKFWSKAWILPEVSTATISTSLSRSKSINEKDLKLFLLNKNWSYSLIAVSYTHQTLPTKA